MTLPVYQRCRSHHVQCSHHHAALCRDYWSERERQETAMENAGLGYAAEMAEYARDHPLITFKDWLVGHKVPWEQRQ